MISLRKITVQWSLSAVLLKLLFSQRFNTHCSIFVSAEALMEDERVKEYHRRGHVWPPQEYAPPTEGWKRIHERRFQQIASMDDSGDRYQGYMLAVHSGLTGRNFTEYGWGVTKAPQAVIDKLKKRLHDGMEKDNKINEGDMMGCIDTKKLPYFLPDDDMNQEILNELLPLHEAWSGVKLIPNNAYGLRVYRDETNLNMHVDQTSTHIISSILHVDHGENDEPWPIVIEDYHGNINEVFLESGDMLFYESSKCMHGRPRKMHGKFYSSLFSHYYPADWNADEVQMDIHYRIPETWNMKIEKSDDIENLSMVSTSMVENGCENTWCSLKNSVKWYGPAPGYGKVLSGDSQVIALKGIPLEESFAKNGGTQGSKDEL